MLSYQHGYHAGNFADVHKHLLLCLLLDALKSKDAAFFVLDAFAGRGLYALDSAESHKTGEYRQGIACLWQAGSVPEDAQRYLALVQQCNDDDSLARYPGSPWLIQQLLRPQDRMAACELHPAEFTALRQHIQARRGLALHQRDAYESMRGLLPPKERRGLLFVDPSYEVKSEYSTLADAVIAVHRHWREGMYALWYPLLAAGGHCRLRQSLQSSGIRKIIDCTVRPGRSDAPGMYGSGMLLINPPWQLDERLRTLLPWLAQHLSDNDESGWTLNWLVPE